MPGSGLMLSLPAACPTLGPSLSAVSTKPSGRGVETVRVEGGYRHRHRGLPGGCTVESEGGGCRGLRQ